MMPSALLFGIGGRVVRSPKQQLLSVLEFHRLEAASEQGFYPESSKAQPQTLCSLHQGLPKVSYLGLALVLLFLGWKFAFLAPFSKFLSYFSAREWSSWWRPYLVFSVCLFFCILCPFCSPLPLSWTFLLFFSFSSFTQFIHSLIYSIPFLQERFIK